MLIILLFAANAGESGQIHGTRREHGEMGHGTHRDDCHIPGGRRPPEHLQLQTMRVGGLPVTETSFFSSNLLCELVIIYGLTSSHGR